MIHTSLSPNTQKDDLLLALKHLFLPPPKNILNQLESEFKKTFGFKHVFLTNSGRSAFYLLLKALDLPPKSRVATQAFTCNAAVNPLLWAGLKPLYIDIDSTFNLDPNDLEKKLSKALSRNSAKALLVQHTFGTPANLKKILPLVKKYNLILIEDCAHGLGSRYQSRWCGSFGTASYFSFGRDKVISSVFGGALATNSDSLAEKIKKSSDSLSYPSPLWTLKQLKHPLIFAIGKVFYHPLFLGKLYLAFHRKIGIIIPAVAEKENHAEMPEYFPAKLPPRLAPLVLNQLKKLGTFHHHRQLIYQLYQSAFKNLPQQIITPDSQPSYLRFSLITPQASEISEKLKRKGGFLDNWYRRVIDPPKGNLSSFNYTPGSCPNAERLAGNVLSLPTHIQMNPKKAERLIKLIDFYLKT